jgi:hypothetical protein
VPGLSITRVHLQRQRRRRDDSILRLA